MLAERAIKAAKPAEKDQFLSDGNGLYVRIQKSGRKVFVYKDQRGGNTKWVTFGSYPDLTLAEARQKAQALKSGSSTTTVMTLREAIDRYYIHVESVYKRPHQTVRKLEPNLAKPLGHVRLASITRSVLTQQFQIIRDRGAPVMANRVMEETKKLFRFIVEKGWMKDDPLLGVTRRVAGGPERSRSVTLSFEEIPAFLKMVSEARRMDPGTAWALYFSLLTGCRIGEALWCLRNKTLDVPEEKSKYRTHKIPATPAVMAVLKLATAPPKHVAAVNAVLRKNNCHYTPHDLRRTFASRLADLGVMPHVIEKLLNHQMEGVMAVYNRAEFWPERIAAQKLWSRKLRELRKKVPGELGSTLA